MFHQVIPPLTTGVRVSRIWNNINIATWVAFGVALGFLGSASKRTGKPLWWIDGEGLQVLLTAGLVYLSVIVVIGLSTKRSRYAVSAGFLIGIAHIVSAATDVSGPRGAALSTLLVSTAATLATIASLAGAPNTSSPQHGLQLNEIVPPA